MLSISLVIPVSSFTFSVLLFFSSIPAPKKGLVNMNKTQNHPYDVQELSFRIYQLTSLEIRQSEKKVIHKKSALGNKCLQSLCSNTLFFSYSSTTLGIIAVHSKSSDSSTTFQQILFSCKKVLLFFH